jgi:hypothetical protein
MTVIERSIQINAPLDITFDISNRLEDWPEIMKEYTRIEILRLEGSKVWFRVTLQNDASWTSWRVIHRPGGFAFAERHEPRAPFRFMQIVWTYRGISSQKTEMTWRMNFDLAEAYTQHEQRIFSYLIENTEKNQRRMREHIERLAGC